MVVRIYLSASVAAVAIGSQVMQTITGIILGLTTGTTVLIAIATGARDDRQVASTIGSSIWLFALLGISLTLVMTLCHGAIASLMHTPVEAMRDTKHYILICSIGIPFIMGYNVICGILRGLGDSKSPMYFIAIACAVNIGLDYLFMGVFHLGPAGAALGTTLSQTISVGIALLFLLKRKPGIPLRKTDLKPKKYILGGILKTGIPISLQDGFIQISFLVITIIANSRGLTDAAAVGIVEKIISFLFLVPSSMLSTVSALGAQNIGAGRKDRALQALRYAILITTSFGFIAAVLMQWIAQPVVGLFTEDSAVIFAGGQYLKGYIWDCFLAGIHFSFSGYFCACQRSEFSFLHNFFSIILVRIPGAYLTSKYFPHTLFPMGLATAAGSLLSVILCVLFFLTLRRKGHKTPVSSCPANG